METKTDLSTDTIQAIRDLVRINSDSAKGFQSAAEAIDSDAIGHLFRGIAQTRTGHADELAKFIDVTNEREGSFKGQLHRWWIEARSLFTDGNAAAVLSEAERGEDEIKARYETLMKANPGNAVSDVLHRQFQEVKRHHDQIRDLRDAERG